MKESNREKLNFSKYVKEAFIFLHDFGYLIQYEDEFFVKYVGQNNEIKISHEKLSYEIDIGLSQGGNANNYSLGLLIELLDGSIKYRNPSATIEELVEEFIFVQAELFRKYGERIITGDTEIWVELEELAKEISSKMEIESKLLYVREKAEKAFREQRYKDVISLLSDVEFYLTPAEKKKLAYARNH